MKKQEAIDKVREWGEECLDSCCTYREREQLQKEMEEIVAFLELNLREPTPNTNTVLQDQDPMPFGKHKGVQMQDVPASYMFWLWTECGYEKKFGNEVADYIRRNLEAFKKEYEDGVW